MAGNLRRGAEGQLRMASLGLACGAVETEIASQQPLSMTLVLDVSRQSDASIGEITYLSKFSGALFEQQDHNPAGAR